MPSMRLIVQVSHGTGHQRVLGRDLLPIWASVLKVPLGSTFGGVTGHANLRLDGLVVSTRHRVIAAGTVAVLALHGSPGFHEVAQALTDRESFEILRAE